MSSTQISFSPEIVENSFQFERFMSGEDAIKRVISSKNQIKKGEQLYFNRWQVVWITITTPFAYLLSYLISSVSWIMHGLSCKKTARIFHVLSAQLIRKSEQLSNQRKFGKTLLVPTCPEHQLTSWDVYQHGHISIDKEKIPPMTAKKYCTEVGIKNGLTLFYLILKPQTSKKCYGHWTLSYQPYSEQWQKKITEESLQLYEKEGIDAVLKMLESKHPHPCLGEALDQFYDRFRSDMNTPEVAATNLCFKNGICRGASLWFIHLFLKTYSHFQDQKKHLKAVASEFITGVPGQGALLQGFQTLDKLLKMENIYLHDHRSSLRILDYHQNRARKKCASLPPGLYRVGVYSHSFVYCKLSEKEGYIWNPNTGLLPKNKDQLFDFVLEKNYMPNHPNSSIYFEQYATFENPVEQQEIV